MGEDIKHEAKGNSFSRRDFLKAGIAGAAVVGLGSMG